MSRTPAKSTKLHKFTSKLNWKQRFSRPLSNVVLRQYLDSAGFDADSQPGELTRITVSGTALCSHTQPGHYLITSSPCFGAQSRPALRPQPSEADGALAQAAQGGCGISFSGAIPDPPGRGAVQPALGDPAWAGGWAGWPTEVPSNPDHSVILWFLEGQLLHAKKELTRRAVWRWLLGSSLITKGALALNKIKQAARKSLLPFHQVFFLFCS